MQHLKRWLTAIILIPLILWILIKGNTLLVAALVSVVAIFAVREYLDITCKADKSSTLSELKVISYATSMILVVGACLGSWLVMFLILGVNLLALSVLVLSRFSSSPKIFDLVSRQVLGVTYIPMSLSFIVFIREFSGGISWIIWLLIVAFANDTGAFYTGTYFGKRKLAPKISPNKTVEGALGGLGTAGIAGFVFNLIFFHDLSLAFAAFPCALVMAAAGQVGDLFESAMKRVNGIKDSGRILPGHGGMLDRIDGLLLAIPVLYVFLVFFR